VPSSPVHVSSSRGRHTHYSRRSVEPTPGRSPFGSSTPPRPASGVHTPRRPIATYCFSSAQGDGEVIYGMKAGSVWGRRLDSKGLLPCGGEPSTARARCHLRSTTPGARPWRSRDPQDRRDAPALRRSASAALRVADPIVKRPACAPSVRLPERHDVRLRWPVCLPVPKRSLTADLECLSSAGLERQVYRHAAVGRAGSASTDMAVERDERRLTTGLTTGGPPLRRGRESWDRRGSGSAEWPRPPPGKKVPLSNRVVCWWSMECCARVSTVVLPAASIAPASGSRNVLGTPTSDM